MTRRLVLVLGIVVVLSAVVAGVAGAKPTPVDDRGESVPPSSHLGGSAGTSTADTASTVSSCRGIDQPGTYELTANVTMVLGSDEPCIRITADNVTVDRSGHRIEGAATGSNPTGTGPGSR